MTRPEWEASVLGPTRASAPERASSFRTSSGHDIDVTSTPDDLAGIDYDRDIADPGVFPFTRGVHHHGYQRRPWTPRQIAGFGTPAEANARYRRLLDSGATGLSVVFDLPTRMGRDPDHPLSAREVGRCGVSVASLADMLDLFDAIDLGTASVSMAINGPAPMVFALYLAAAERRGVPWATLSGTLQNDILEEFLAQKEFIYPPRPSMRLVTDVIAFCHTHVPRWHPVLVSGYHMREAGATAQQELSFTMGDAIAYVSDAVAAGLDVDGFGPRISFFFSAQSDFFEELAKFRAARQVWARVMRERFGAKTDRACALCLHVRTSGVSLTAQQPYNNVARTTFQALAAVLGGTNSLHTNTFDEALGLPTAGAATLALRTQQVLRHECGLTGEVDPFGGSWWVERLTRDFVTKAMSDIEEIDRMGGMVAAIERGVPQQRIADASHRTQGEIESGRRAIVGVNTCLDAEPHRLPILAIDDVANNRAARVQSVRRDRDAGAAVAALEALRRVAAGAGNTMERLVDCARAGVTVGEMCDVLRAEWGEYVESVATQVAGASAVRHTLP